MRSWRRSVVPFVWGSMLLPSLLLACCVLFLRSNGYVYCRVWDALILVRFHLFCRNSTLSFWKSSVLLARGRIFFLCGDIRVWCSELWFWGRGLGLGLSVCFYMQVRISMLRSFGGRSSLTCCGFCCEWDVGSTGSCPALCASHGPRDLTKPGASDSRLSRFFFFPSSSTSSISC